MSRSILKTPQKSRNEEQFNLKTIQEEVDFKSSSRSNVSSCYGKTMNMQDNEPTLFGEKTQIFNIDELSDDALALPEENHEYPEHLKKQANILVQPSEITYANFPQFKADLNSFQHRERHKDFDLQIELLMMDEQRSRIAQQLR